MAKVVITLKGSEEGFDANLNLGGEDNKKWKISEFEGEHLMGAGLFSLTALHPKLLFVFSQALLQGDFDKADEGYALMKGFIEDVVLEGEK